MKPKILLVNPPIYDFTAYDFWLKPYGLLQVAGQLDGFAEMKLFDYLDRVAARREWPKPLRQDDWHRGSFPRQDIQTPAVFRDTNRYFHRFGRSRERFQALLESSGPFDFVLIQTVMTYWYLGVREVIEDVRRLSPKACIVLGGLYASLCPDHAAGLGADWIIRGSRLDPLYERMGIGEVHRWRPAWWKGYRRIDSAAIRITRGCPFQCTYCSAPMLGEGFSVLPPADCVAELRAAMEVGARDVAFYDDALLYRPADALLPFLDAVENQGVRVNLHTPNALHARLLTAGIAHKMVITGFKTFYLGFESISADWQRRTGDKVTCTDLADAVEHLRLAGAAASGITAYQIVGHPDSDIQQLEETMRYIHSLGIRIMLSEFSPIPGTPDGDRCGTFADLSEPLNHNKTAFAIRRLGFDTVARLKDYCHQLNARLSK